jgi:glutamate N-acetyltransferase/amino-acid N-acetyltransferase
MTTDTVKKEIALLFSIGGKICRIGSIAKGSGMINPNMATMLCFITTDAAVSPAMLQKALSSAVQDTFNQISVDGDTSTNDTVMLLANGQAKNLPITDEGEGYEAFAEALKALCALQAKAIAKDGEGATKLIECAVSGAPDTQTARAVSKSVIGSSLLKAAIFGEDANWGRILCAIGYTPGDFDIDKAEVTLRSAAGELFVCQNAQGVLFCEQKAKKVLSETEITIAVDLHSGCGHACAWGCDLTYDYVKINGDYRT